MLRKILKICVEFLGGIILGQTYYYYLLKQIPFPDHVGIIISWLLCIVLGLGNVASIQLRCISLLILPMYCGKPGRSVLKALVLTHIVAGPISNMGLNAKEVVRVFACTTKLSYNISKERYNMIYEPLKQSSEGLETEVENVKETFSAITDVTDPLSLELEGTEEADRNMIENNFIDDTLTRSRRSELIIMLYENSTSNPQVNFYRMKLKMRCEAQISKSVLVCIKKFSRSYSACHHLAPEFMKDVCMDLKYNNVCDLIDALERNNNYTLCNSNNEVPLSAEAGFEFIESIKKEFCSRVNRIKLNYTTVEPDTIYNIQDANETARRVVQAFDEKTVIMRYIFIAMNIAMALIFLRIFNAAVTYHDCYLTDIDYDNVYITSYFKRIDMRRKMREKFSLLPLKKMERNEYIDVHSLVMHASQRSKLVSQILKVKLEVVTATTFVMLDRLFYEALDVVRQHAEMELANHATRDLHISVEGTSIISSPIQKFLNRLNTLNETYSIKNPTCLPRPRQMPYIYFFKIYGGYLWILLLLLINPYTLRVRRSICSYFYPRREKQRILHLYNDILKKRMKMDKTLRRKTVQAIRAHYLTGESLLSMRLKFPRVLGWLQVLPAARMMCLICDEVEPRSNAIFQKHWYSCSASNCPFVYCEECWHEVGSRCLACDSALAELSDVESVSLYEPLEV